MSEKVWQCKRVEVLYRFIRLFARDSSGGKWNLWAAWRTLALNRHPWPYSQAWPNARSASRRSCLRFALVRPWRQSGLQLVSKRSRVHLWTGHFGTVQSRQWTQINREGSLVGNGRVLIDSRKQHRDSVQCAELLLQVCQSGCDHWSRRAYEPNLLVVRTCTKKRRTARDEENSRLFLVIPIKKSN